MKRDKQWFYLIEKEHLRSQTFGVGVEGVLDMLRYDGARIESNAPDGYWLLSCLGNYPVVARWKSFGIRIRVMDLCRNALDVREILEDERKREAQRGERLAKTMGMDPRDG